MSNQILFCNIGWMERYKGITDTDKIIGGGRYVKDNSEGGEIYNFLNRNGYCYGYVQPVNSSRNITGGTINIEKLGAPKGANSISNVDVIMTATSPTEGGTYVIGWYKNATIYRDKQYFDISQGSFGLDTQGNQYGYRFYAPYTEATLLPRDQRTLKIPRATGKSPVKGGMGQSNVWYAQDLKDEDFFKKTILSNQEIFALLYFTVIIMQKTLSMELKFCYLNIAKVRISAIFLANSRP